MSKYMKWLLSGLAAVLLVGGSYYLGTVNQRSADQKIEKKHIAKAEAKVAASIRSEALEKQIKSDTEKLETYAGKQKGKVWTRADYNALTTGDSMSYGDNGTLLSEVVKKHGEPAEKSEDQYDDTTSVSYTYTNIKGDKYGNVILDFEKQGDAPFTLVSKYQDGLK